MNYDIKNKIPFESIEHNRRLVYLSNLAENYVSYFNLDYLFINAKSVRYFYINNVGLYYLLELPLFLTGLFIMLKRKTKSDLLILGLLFLAPIPAMITLGKAFIHRGLLLIPMIQLITAIGAISLADTLKKSSKILIVLTIGLYFFSVNLFLHQYLIHSPNEFTSENDNGAWFSTVRDAIPKINEKKTKYDQVVFTWSQGKLVPPIYYLFYNQIDPRIIQKKASAWTNEPPSYRQIYNQIGNIDFRPINWDKDKDLKNTLFIGYPKEFFGDINVIDKTYLPNGNEHFLLVGTD